MFRLILYLFIFYLVYKGIKFIFRYLFYSNNTNSANNNRTESRQNSKYEDVEEAKIIEIKNDPEKPEHPKEN